MVALRGRNDSAPRQLTAAALRRFRSRLLAWGERNRRTYYWREERLSSFEVLVLEVLLARTRADTVERVARQFLERYGTAAELADAKVQDVEDILRPLGLFRKRAKSLVEMARVLREQHGGTVPTAYSDLVALPYVGRYSASAFLCFHAGSALPAVDANVVRVFARYFGLELPAGKIESAEEYWAVAKRLVPATGAALFNWTLLDLGALVCTPRNPKCGECPLRKGCLEGTAWSKTQEKSSSASSDSGSSPSSVSG